MSSKAKYLGKRPIANKYREGKMKRTRNRESKVRERVHREAIVWQAKGGVCGAGRWARQRGCFHLETSTWPLRTRRPLGAAQATRLETRTKECIYTASLRVASL